MVSRPHGVTLCPPLSSSSESGCSLLGVPRGRDARREELAALPWPGTGPAVDGVTPIGVVTCVLAGLAVLVAVVVVAVLAGVQARYWDEPTERGRVTAVSALGGPAASHCGAVMLTVAVERARPGYPSLARQVGCAHAHRVGDLVSLRRDARDPGSALVDPMPAGEMGLIAALAFATVLAMGGTAVAAGRYRTDDEAARHAF